VAGTLDEDLDASLAGTLYEPAQQDEFLELRAVTGIRDAARSKTVSETQREIVGARCAKKGFSCSLCSIQPVRNAPPRETTLVRRP